MAAPTLTQLREQLAESLAVLEGVQVSAWLLANPTAPSLEIGVGEVEFDRSFGRGLDLWRFVVRAYVGLVDDRGAQEQLDALLAPAGATSVKAALEADRTLAGKAQDLRVLAASGYGIYQRAGGPEYLGCEWKVEVHALGK